jgi:hypothetical protein
VSMSGLSVEQKKTNNKENCVFLQKMWLWSLRSAMFWITAHINKNCLTVHRICCVCVCVLEMIENECMCSVKQSTCYHSCKCCKGRCSNDYIFLLCRVSKHKIFCDLIWSCNRGEQSVFQVKSGRNITS